MISVAIDAAGILRWSRYLDAVRARTPKALADALNAYGEGVARGKAQAIADEHDLSWSEVLSMIEVREATPGRLEWSMDSSALESDDVMRQMPKRSGKDFEAQTLVKVVTSGDGNVCPICDEAADKSPWAVYELDEFVARHGNFLTEHPDWTQGPGERSNLLHPNCRCTTQPWASKRRVSVTFGAKGAPPELMTARQLGERVAAEMRVAISVKG
jgi:hypothetical protein